MKSTQRLTIVLALSAALGLSACGGADGDATEGVTAGTTDGTPAATQQDDDATEDGTVDSTDDDGASGSDDDDTASGSDDATGAVDGDLTAFALAAIDTAEAETGGVAYEIDDQDDDGTWEVDVRVDDRSVEVTVSADGRTVEGTEDDDLDDDDRAGLDAATITLQEAIEAAVAEAGGVLDDAELKEEDGSHRWEVSLDGTDRGDDVEVLVSVTGEVLGLDD